MREQTLDESQAAVADSHTQGRDMQSAAGCGEAPQLVQLVVTTVLQSGLHLVHTEQFKYQVGEDTG